MVKGTTPAVGCRRKHALSGQKLCDASRCISMCLSQLVRAGEGSGRTERSPTHSQRRCYFNNTPLACMSGLILTLEPRQAGPNFPRCDLSQPFPFENKVPVPAPLSPQAAARCRGSCPTGQGKVGQDLPLGRLFGEREGSQRGPPWCSAPHHMRIFGSWLEAKGCSDAEPSPGSWSSSVFHRHLWEGGAWDFSTDIFIENAVWRFIFFAFFFFLSLFSDNSHARERDFPSPLCVYLKTDW